MISSRLLALWRFASRPFPTDHKKEPFFYRAWKWAWQKYSTHRWDSNLFTRISETEWDVLIILDACRYDTLSEIATEVVVEPASSPASATPAFLEKSYEAGIFDDTIYISANPQTDDQKPGRDITHIPLYLDHWDSDLATVTPETVYENVREYVGQDKPIVAHTVQPHYPHICEIGHQVMAVPGGLHASHLADDEKKKKLQNLLADGDIKLETARRSYRSCTHFAWETARDFAGDLVSNGYTVAITADHGELFGEYGFVGHPSNVNVEPLVTVPWVVLEPPRSQETANSVDERLTALGYMSE